MNKVLVLGAGGMAGHVIATHLREVGYAVTTLTAHNRLDDETVLLDVMNTKDLTKLLSNNTFDIIVNAIGMLVKASDSRKDLSVYLNSYLPHQLEQFYENTSTKLIHLSTDCVFSGKNGPYTESSLQDGDLFYDRTKALGEVINGKDLTFRMSIIGPDMQEEGIGLFNWFMAQTGEINGYTKAMWNGVTTIQLAQAIDCAIEQSLTGLYHLVPGENISKYELLRLFKTVFNRDDILIKPIDGVNLDKTLINTRGDFDFVIPSYQQMVEDMKTWIERHHDKYSHYSPHYKDAI